MKAITYQGSDVALLDVAKPAPSAHELLVRVRATALNRADLLQRRGAYPGPDPSPDGHRISGLEYAGYVDAMGPAVSQFTVGDRVFGLVSTGGHAEFVVVDERLAMPIPETLDWREAAAIPEAFLTAYDALFNRGALKPGHTVLVHAGGSGVGTACLQLSTTANATAIATVGTSDKAERVCEMGAKMAINYKTERFSDAVLNHTADVGVDLIIDFVGAPYLADNIRALRKGGTIVSLGFLGGDRCETSMKEILLKWVTIVGSTLRGRPFEERIKLCKSFVSEWLPLFDVGRLSPVVDSTFPFEGVIQAHELMENNTNFGKIILTP